MVSGETALRLESVEDFTHHYPWCALGHKFLFSALCAQGEEAYLSYASKASAYLFNRKELYTTARTPKPVPIFVPELKEKPDEKKPDEKVSDDFGIIPDPVKPIVVVSGDYFGQELFNAAMLEDKNPIDKFIKTNPKLTPVRTIHEEQSEEKVSLLEAGDDNFMTETLARIYVDQSLYQLAIEAYQKLILLYPKKSDYFATLIQELKYKMIR